MPKDGEISGYVDRVTKKMNSVAKFISMGEDSKSMPGRCLSGAGGLSLRRNSRLFKPSFVSLSDE